VEKLADAAAHGTRLDGVMMGRAAYKEPWKLLAVDPLLFGQPEPFPTHRAVLEALIPYIDRELARGTRLHSITRHLLGLFQAVPGARAFRRHLATAAVKSDAGAQVLREAMAMLQDIPAEFANSAAA
jgi:tRNA-dihydrouridine synthase A